MKAIRHYFLSREFQWERVGVGVALGIAFLMVGFLAFLFFGAYLPMREHIVQEAPSTPFWQF